MTKKAIIAQSKFQYPSGLDEVAGMRRSTLIGCLEAMHREDPLDGRIDKEALVQEMALLRLRMNQVSALLDESESEASA